MKDLILAAGMWIWERRAGVLWSIILVVAGTVAVYLSAQSLGEQRTGSSVRAVVGVAVGILALGLAGHFVHCFTRNLPGPQKTLTRELRSIFAYAYVFQALMIGVSLVPFVVSTGPMSSSESWAGFVHGCVRGQEGNGSGLTQCTNGSADGQWLLHIGSRPLELEVGTDGEAGGRAELGRGLVVPLYVVVLAIIGGAVGMTRRLPEIQRRAAFSVHDMKERTAISPIQAREQVVFHIMQVLAAPLIAIVAFSAFDPDTVTAAVLIGFASGFASEAILMKLRQASEAVMGIAKSESKKETSRTR